jgi:hypothetical protein
MAIIRMTSGTWSRTHVGVGRLGRCDLVAVWTGHVEDDGGFLAILLFSDGGEGAEELVGDVGEDGGAAGGDFVLREERSRRARKSLIWAAEVKSSRLAVRVEAISAGSG